MVAINGAGREEGHISPHSELTFPWKRCFHLDIRYPHHVSKQQHRQGAPCELHHHQMLPFHLCLYILRAYTTNCSFALEYPSNVHVILMALGQPTNGALEARWQRLREACGMRAQRLLRPPVLPRRSNQQVPDQFCTAEPAPTSTTTMPPSPPL